MASKHSHNVYKWEREFDSLELVPRVDAECQWAATASASELAAEFEA